jgi:DNA (cytosine-5)-methyltransferase 1
MKAGSLFAGIGGFDLGFERAGFDIAWCVEKDEHAQKVLRARFPKAQIYGDITAVDPLSLCPVDVIYGGFPCQDLSVAGRRAGLKGERSGLFFDAMRIVRSVHPRLLVLENVPGMLTSNNGLDFAAVIREVGEGWDCEEVAWRVLDSRYFGVAQRRKRCFLVASATEGCAEQVLALSESMLRDPPTSIAPRQAIAAASQEGTRGCGKWWDGGDTAASLTTKSNEQYMPDKGNFAAVVIDRAAYNQGENAAYEPHIKEEDTMPALVARGPHAVAFRKVKRAQSNTDNETWMEDSIANTLNGFDLGDTRTTHVIAEPDMIVRRLTPDECELLQGFPVGWTSVGTHQKPTSDSRRYKQLGNAVTVNVAEWIARRAHGVLCSQGVVHAERTHPRDRGEQPESVLHPGA